MKPSLPTLSHDALYAKSQAYMCRGFRAHQAGDMEEYQLWASLAMELVGKAALAKIHPALVADPTNFPSLFAACGRSITTDIKTITAKTLFERLSHVTKEFDARYKGFCEQMALCRNAEIHSGESPFSGIRAEAWEAEFWGAAEAILRCQERDLSSWLGTQNAKAPLETVRQVNEGMERAIQARIERYRKSFEVENKHPNERKKRIEESSGFNYSTWTFRFPDGEIKRYLCPACGGLGALNGSFWDEDIVETDSGVAYETDDGNLYQELPTEFVEETFTVEEFACATCKLSLYGTKEIAAADFPPDFTRRETRVRDFEPDYGND